MDDVGELDTNVESVDSHQSNLITITRLSRRCLQCYPDSYQQPYIIKPIIQQPKGNK